MNIVKHFCITVFCCILATCSAEVKTTVDYFKYEKQTIVKMDQNIVYLENGSAWQIDKEAEFSLQEDDQVTLSCLFSRDPKTDTQSITPGFKTPNKVFPATLIVFPTSDSYTIDKIQFVFSTYERCYLVTLKDGSKWLLKGVSDAYLWKAGDPIHISIVGQYQQVLMFNLKHDFAWNEVILYKISKNYEIFDLIQ